MTNQISNFTVLNRAPNGILDREESPNTLEFTYVTSAVNIALEMLNHPTSRRHLVEFALTFERTQLRRILNDDFNTAEAAVDLFIRKIRSRFPIIVMDHSITSADMLGCHDRGHWDGPLEDFNPRGQMININGGRVQDMVAASRNNQSARFREFQFLFATTFCHEAGAHLLITFITNGRPTTPPEISAPGYGSIDGDKGEAGRYFELQLFGGTTEYYADPGQDRHQAGLPYQIDRHGWAWRIDKSVIEDVCRYRFRFPFAREGAPVDPNSMRTVGRTFHGPAMNSGSRTMMARQQPIRPSPSILAGHNIQVRDLIAIPMHPERRLIAVA